jgi:putrescine transport system substrate-binding protein
LRRSEGAARQRHARGRAGNRAGLLLAALALCACQRAREPQLLYVYNWGNYIGSHTIDDFERATGMQVVYDTYDSSETRDAKLMAGDSGYDVVLTEMEYFGPQIRAGVYTPLDKTLLPNWSNLDPQALAVESANDPGNRYASPFLRGVSGFAYDVERIRERMPDAPVDSLAMIFDPKVIRRFADCGVSFLDGPGDVLMLAFSYLHIDPNTRRPEDYARAEQLVLDVRPYIRTFESVGFMAELANRELCLSMSWSADYSVAMMQAQRGGRPLRLKFSVPREGAVLTYDAWLIPASAPHPRAAHAFINFMLDPKVVAAITNDIHYGNFNRAANSYVSPEILSDPAVYPTPEVEARMHIARELNPAVVRLRTRIWTRIKTGH